MYSEFKANNSALEGAVRLKQAPLDISLFIYYRVPYFPENVFRTPKKKPWTIVHGFWPETENFDFGKTRYQAIVYLKASILTTFQLHSTLQS